MKMDNDVASQVPSETVSSRKKGPLWGSRVRGNLVRTHAQKFGNLPEDLQLTAACDEASFTSNVSQGQFFMTIPDVRLRGYGSANSCRQFSYLRSDDRSQPKEFIRDNTKIGSVLEVLVTKYYDRCGIEIKIDSMQVDGTQSWMVISRGVFANTSRSLSWIIQSLFIMTKRFQARRKLL